MESLYPLCELVVTITGPLMLASVVMMYISVWIRTGKPPMPTQALYLYVKDSVAKRRHAGVLAYMLFVSTLFFITALVYMATIRLRG